METTHRSLDHSAVDLVNKITALMTSIHRYTQYKQRRLQPVAFRAATRQETRDG